jgi:hypothetical protein
MNRFSCSDNSTAKEDSDELPAPVSVLSTSRVFPLVSMR